MLGSNGGKGTMDVLQVISYFIFINQLFLRVNGLRGEPLRPLLKISNYSFRLFLFRPASPIKPMPSSQTAPGSGTVEAMAEAPIEKS
jgi:hypothetical protein